jgi:hypothetical protein
MKRSLILIATLLALQALFLFGSIWFSISVRSDCSFVSNEVGMWQCTGDQDPLVVPLLAFAVIPPLLAKLLLDALKRHYSWKRIIFTHVLVAVLFYGVLFYLDTPHCGCGGA